MKATKTRIGILGATGGVGQKLVSLLRDHPWFEVTAVAASDGSAGRRYGDCVHWLEPEPVPAGIAVLALEPVRPGLDCDLVVSALPTEVARKHEPILAACGHTIVTNAAALRMHPDVPLVVPEINPHHLAVVERRPPGHGAIVANPNCATAGLVMALKPLADAFGLEAVAVTTLQAASGAGWPGVPSLDLLGNVIPEIPGEEEKLATEPARILGRATAAGIEPLELPISAQCTRVPVVDGHLLSVSVRLASPAGLADVRAAMLGFEGAAEARALPSGRARPLELLDDGPVPQPRLHAGRGGGMTVTVGRLRTCPVLSFRFVVLVHNTIRGAAGAALLNAELLVQRCIVGAGAQAMSATVATR